MLTVGTPDKLIAHRVAHEGRFKGISDLMIESEIGQGPQAFLVRQAPNWTLPAHFHQQFQFQVVLEGDGTLGPHKLSPITVHYASPQAVYGPIVSGSSGLSYFTLRVLSDRGVWYMPDRRADLKMGMFKEQKTSEAKPGNDGHGQALLPLREDGLGAWHLRGRSGQSVHCEEGPSPAGRFYIVTAGTCVLAGRTLPRFSCVYWSPPDAMPVFEAGQDGCELVAVQFPAQALKHVVAPEVVASATMLPFVSSTA